MSATSRVVSLVPSVTETLLAFGVAPVACTRFCDAPGITTVGGTKDPDVAAIVALEPDLVVVNDEENRAEDADALRAAGLTLHEMSPRSVSDVVPAVHALADAVRASVPAGFAVAEPSDDEPVRAFIPIWRRPWMTFNAETYGSSALAHVGIANVFADAPDRYPETSLVDMRSRDPAVVLLPDEPYRFSARHADEFPGLRVQLVDGRDLFWWGIRTPAALERMRAWR